MSRAIPILVACAIWLPPTCAQDLAPIGAIGYFDGACPAGWRHYDRAAGRAIVPVGQRGLGRSVGAPLAEGQQLRHTHEGSAAIRLEGSTIRARHANVPMREIAQVDSVELDTDIGESSSELPSARFNVCLKTEEAVGAAPAGMVLFFIDPVCPVDWSPFEAANGRFLSGAEPAGPIGAFGSTRALNDGEDRVHSHLIRGPAELATVEDTVWSGCSTCSRRWAMEESYEYRGQAKPASSGLPYIQLRACSKDAPSGPQISRVTHAADFRQRPLAVGQHATIFGQGMGPLQGVGASLDADGRVSGLRAGVEVLVDEVAAPLFFVRDDQINFQVPYEVAGRPSVRIVVVRDGEPGPAYEAVLASTAPALFAWSDDPSRAIAVHADGALNGPANPAESGQAIILFATGGGRTSPPGITGAPARAPFPAPLADVELRIGGEPAILDYAGAAPGFVGLMQINARMTATSGKAAVVLKIGNEQTALAVSIYGR